MNLELTMRRFLPLLLLVLAVAGFRQQLHATHVLGVTVTYECLGASQYRIHHHTYVDCQGLPCSAPSNLTITGVGGGCTAPTLGPWVFQSSNEVTMFATSMPTTCNGGSAPGVRDCYYTRDANFTGVSCTKYVLGWSECCRIGSITNLSNPSAQSRGVSTDTLNLGLAPCNSSPVWHIAPPFYAVKTQANYFDLGGEDPDGDSLSYRMVAPVNASMSPLAYNLGYSPTSPLGSNWFVNLNTETGLLGLVPVPPASLQFAAMSIIVDEWRGGVRIGSVRRDFDLNVLPSMPANQLPVITGPLNVTGGMNFGGALVVSPGTTLCADFNATDPDPGVATQLTWMSDVQGGMLTDTFGSPPDTVFAVGPWARVCITAPNRLGSDTVTITAIDTTRQLNNMVIHGVPVFFGAAELVWPGDANNDLIADAFDLLPIGVAFGSTGNTRPGASNTWVGQSCFPWQDTITGGIDKKFIDCDGNGLIDANDTLPVSLNYGLTHTKGNIPYTRTTGSDPVFRIVLPDSADVGDTIEAPILLGDGSVPASNVLGWAFRMHYDESLIDSSTFWIDFNNSWVSPGGNAMEIQRNHPTLYNADAAQVRTTHTTVSGNGEVCRAHFVIIDNIDGKRQALDSAALNIFFTDVRVIRQDGSLMGIDVQSDSMLVYDRTTDQHQAPVTPRIDMYPNPATQGRTVTVEAQGMDIQSVEVWSIQGQMLMQLNGPRKRFELNTEDLAQGLFFMKARTQAGWTVRQLVLD
ncbi:MAG: T9SS type A sorting domain-containing protein [Bacteroidia bacterium]